MTQLAPLRARLEESFSPLSCDCNLNGDGTLTVRLYHRGSGEVDLVVSGLNLDSVRSEESLAKLIDELRYELQNTPGHRNDPV
ncbi:DUF1652 domain-containing protein [Pseudomonas corrugata]|uniref:DUF1652 domain-containing protein n=1 Tax=Pseudomonas corrugata TaxID=47879 RepID=A0A7Y6DKE7_9PSED|nr:MULTISPECIES: DUF1652 domain-containing protein [Pseudomonas]MCI0998235.1 DUF1652 domain-containing protein [Pseudomonas corrugata]NUT66620.1 DUF1652 domain-containing protein [Pseudomonas corrugata]NUT90149.1 DUF1652 domain-containing protein [Pseudomonas corrugata]TNF80150.1 DUF1652 domain-containing protein [Pseudomonas sp. ICMP22404]